MFVVMHDFHGWTASAAWEDTKFGVRHFHDIERLAMVGETKWQHGMAIFCKPFTTAQSAILSTTKSKRRAPGWRNRKAEKVALAS